MKYLPIFLLSSFSILIIFAYADKLMCIIVGGENIKNKYQKLSVEQSDNIYTGFTISAVVMIPFVIKGIVPLISSMKMFATDNGSFNYQNMRSEWSQNKEPKVKAPTTRRETYYPF